MSSSASLIMLSELREGTPSAGTRAYFQARTRNRIYDFILRKFLAEEKQGRLSKADLARRIGRRPEVITRLLGAPGNWTIDTVSDLLLGIAGEEIELSASSPLDAAKRNERAADTINATISQSFTPVSGIAIGEFRVH